MGWGPTGPDVVVCATTDTTAPAGRATEQLEAAEWEILAERARKGNGWGLRNEIRVIAQARKTQHTWSHVGTAFRTGARGYLASYAAM